MTLAFTMPSWEMATRLDHSFNVPSDMKSSHARDQLRSLRFDQAPVMRNGRLLGWVRTTHLVGRGVVESRTTLLDQCTVLARDTPVGDAISAVVNDHLVFLAGPTGISEFVVVSDLDRHAVRCYLYVLVSELEMLMADLADASLTEQELEDHLGSERKRYAKAQAEGLETRPVEYLNFSAYQKLALSVPAIVGSFPGDPADLPVELESLRQLRNCVAHPSKSLTLDFEPQEIEHLKSLTERFVATLRGAQGV